VVGVNKNWLFAASEVGADTVAMFNSLVCICKMNRINILEYLTDALGSLGSKPASALTPLGWEVARKQIRSISRKKSDTAQGGS
jgi:hypothetical protein